MNIYIVTAGNHYEGYSNIAVFTDRQRAEYYAIGHRKKNKGFFDGYYIEEHEVDSGQNKIA